MLGLAARRVLTALCFRCRRPIAGRLLLLAESDLPSAAPPFATVLCRSAGAAHAAGAGAGSLPGAGLWPGGGCHARLHRAAGEGGAWPGDMLCGWCQALGRASMLHCSVRAVCGGVDGHAALRMLCGLCLICLLCCAAGGLLQVHPHLAVLAGTSAISTFLLFSLLMHYKWSHEAQACRAGCSSACSSMAALSLAPSADLASPRPHVCCRSWTS